MDEHLGFPKNDPHGDPIPDKNGVFPKLKMFKLNELKIGEEAILTGVSEDSKEFLRYLDGVNLKLGSEIEVLDFFKFDNSIQVKINNKTELTFSDLVSKNLNVSKDH